MQLVFTPRSEMTHDEIKVIGSFLEELTSGCDKASCNACLFSKYCDTHPGNPADTLLEILDTLGIDLK